MHRPWAYNTYSTVIVEEQAKSVQTLFVRWKRNNGSHRALVPGLLVRLLDKVGALLQWPVTCRVTGWLASVPVDSWHECRGDRVMKINLPCTVIFP